MKLNLKLNRLFLWQTALLLLFCVGESRLFLSLPTLQADYDIINAARPLPKATLNLRPAVSNLEVKQDGQLELQLDNSGFRVEEINLTLSFPADTIRINKLDFSKSPCLNPKQENSSGKVQISCRTSQPAQPQQLESLVTLNYTALKAKTAEIRVLPGSSLISQTKNILRNQPSALIYIQ